MSPQIRGLVLGLTAILVGFPLMGWGYFLTHMVRDGHTDFRATYTAGHMLRTAKPLYDANEQFQQQNLLVSREHSFPVPFKHPAYEAVLYIPLSYLGFVKAYWAWFLLNLLMLAAIYFVLRSELHSLSAIAPWLPCAVFAAYLPFGVALMHGQDTILFTLLLAVSFSLMRHERRLLLAGMILGIAAFRFQILIPIAICFLFWRRWKLLTGFACTASLAAILSVALGGFSPYVRFLLDFSGPGASGTAQELVSSMPNLRGFILSMGGGNLLLALASCGALLITVCVGHSIRNTRQQFGIAIAAALLVSYHGLLHDMGALLIPCAMILDSEALSMALVPLAAVFVPPNVLVFAPHHVYLAVFGPLFLFAFLMARSPLILAVVTNPLSVPAPLVAVPIESRSLGLVFELDVPVPYSTLR